MKKTIIFILIPILFFGQPENEPLKFVDGSYFIGQYKIDNEDYYLSSGKMFDENDKIIFDGQWRNNTPYSGTGRVDFKNGYFIGEYQNNFMWTGIFHQRVDNNFQEIKFSSGKRNDRNYYNKNDITSRYKKTTIELKKDSISEDRWQDNTLKITLGIGQIKHDWIFDTGAENFSISQHDWDKIKNHLNFEDLNISYKSTSANGGVSKGKYVLITSEIQIAEFKVKNIVLGISENKYSLLGISFLEKFRNVEWNMQENKLTLYN